MRPRLRPSRYRRLARAETRFPLTVANDGCRWRERKPPRPRENDPQWPVCLGAAAQLHAAQDYCFRPSVARKGRAFNEWPFDSQLRGKTRVCRFCEEFKQFFYTVSRDGRYAL